jgi:hypothetical protein
MSIDLFEFVLLTKIFLDNSKVETVKNKKTITTKNVNEDQRIFKAIFSIEEDLVLLVIFKYISDNIVEIVTLSLNKIKRFWKRRMIFFKLFCIF